jgi:putative chitinase
MNLEKLKSKVPDSLFNQLQLVIDKFGINSNRKMAHFLSQCAHESGGFKAVQENLNYSAEGLTKIFPKYFPTIELAKQYERQAQRIANRVYANRMGNGDEASGDGYKYRGRGYIQLTGKNNYLELTKFLSNGDDLIANPDLVATKYPLISAAFFFWKNKLSDLAEKATIDLDVTALTKRVNGGTHGLTDRINRFKEYNEILNA